MSLSSLQTVERRTLPAYSLDAIPDYRVSAKLVGISAGQILLGKLAGRPEWVLPGGGKEAPDSPPDPRTRIQPEFQPYVRALWRELHEEGFDIGTVIESFDIKDPLNMQPSFFVGSDIEKPKPLAGERMAHSVLKLCFIAESEDPDRFAIIGGGTDEIDNTHLWHPAVLPDVIHPHESGLVSALQARHEHPGAGPIATISGLPVYGPLDGALTLPRQ